MARAVGAAEEVPIHLDAMTDYLAFAMLANWRHRMDRTFEAVKYVSRSRSFYRKGFAVFVPANVTLCHTVPYSFHVLKAASPLCTRGVEALIPLFRVSLRCVRCPDCTQNL
jgi:hypothetical protein